MLTVEDQKREIEELLKAEEHVKSLARALETPDIIVIREYNRNTGHQRVLTLSENIHDTVIALLNTELEKQKKVVADMRAKIESRE